MLSHCDPKKAKPEHFYSIPKQTSRAAVSGLALTVTLMELDMPPYAEETSASMLLGRLTSGN